MALFDSDFLKKLEYLSLVSRRVFHGRMLAQRRTMKLGGGVEFANHRDYSPGDDFRYLDWNVYARHDSLLLKRFQEEEDLHVYLLLDCSRSMAGGAPIKFDHARRLTAALAYIALANLDRVAVIAFGTELLECFPMTRGKGRILSLLRFLEELKPASTATDLARAVHAFLMRYPRRGLAIVVSDLYDPAGFQQGLDLLRHRKYDLHVLQVYDRGEADPKLLGDLELLDVETEEGQRVTVTEHLLRRYEQVFREFLEAVETYCRTHSLGHTRTTTEVPFDELILRMMRTAGTVN